LARPATRGLRARVGVDVTSFPTGAVSTQAVLVGAVLVGAVVVAAILVRPTVLVGGGSMVISVRPSAAPTIAGLTPIARFRCSATIARNVGINKRLD